MKRWRYAIVFSALMRTSEGISETNNSKTTESPGDDNEDLILVQYSPSRRKCWYFCINRARLGLAR